MVGPRGIGLFSRLVIDRRTPMAKNSCSRWWMLAVVAFALLIPVAIEAQVGSRGSATQTPRPQVRPTPRPTQRPQVRPTPRPTQRPTQRPQARPTPRPTQRPQVRPTPRPTSRPQARPAPVSRPTTVRPTTNRARPGTSAGGSTTTLPPRSSGTSGRTVLPRSSTASSSGSGVLIPTPRTRPTVRPTLRPTLRIPREPVPSPAPRPKPLPALRKPNRDEGTRELLGTTLRRQTLGSTTGIPERRVTTILRKPGSRADRNATGQLIDRISKPGRIIRKPSVLGTPSSTGVIISSGRRGSVASIPSPPSMPLPPLGGSSTHLPGGSTVYHWPSHQLPWYCIPSHGSYYGGHLGSWVHYGPVWTYPWTVTVYSPWYLYHPDPWCFGWSLPWNYCSTTRYRWWHHGHWGYGSSALWWENRYGSDPYIDDLSDATIEFADETTESVPFEEDLESYRASLCDGRQLLSQGDGVAALPHIDEALLRFSDHGLPWLLRSMGSLLVDDVERAAADLGEALDRDPSLLSIRWDESQFLGDQAPQVRTVLWDRLELDPADAAAASMVALLSLLSDDVADAPSRGALSEMLLDGNGDATTVVLHGALRGESPAQPSAAASWLLDPSCVTLVEAMP